MYFLRQHRNRVISICIVVLFLLGAYTVITYRFSTVVEKYLAAAGGHDTAAYLPGSPDNATRLVLNRILSEILTRPHSASERNALAQEGLQALEVSEQEIDAIGLLGENVTHTIGVLENRTALFHSEDKRAFLEIAHRRFDIAGDIRGLSYLANHHIAEIFNRIIQDGGELTSAHTAALNRQIPEVEADFDRRATLYRELESLAFQLQQGADDLIWPW